jgi:hypothetical protein
VRRLEVHHPLAIAEGRSSHDLLRCTLRRRTPGRLPNGQARNRIPHLQQSGPSSIGDLTSPASLRLGDRRRAGQVDSPLMRPRQEPQARARETLGPRDRSMIGIMGRLDAALVWLMTPCARCMVGRDCATHEKQRVVRDGNLITAGGVTSGFDFPWRWWPTSLGRRWPGRSS